MAKPKICICLGSSCFARGNAKNVDVTEKFLEDHGLKDDVDVELMGGLCEGHCAEGPNVRIEGQLYGHVDTGVMLDLLNQLFPGSGGEK